MKALLFTALVALALPVQAQKAPMTENPTPPVAAKKPHSYTRHGYTISDEYFWMKDQSYPKIDDAEILDHLKAENAYFEAMMAPRAALVETIFQEMKGRIKEDESSVPQKDGRYLYWRRFEKGAQYKQWLRKPVAGGPETVILDEARLAEGKEYFRLGGIAISEDDRFMAYSTDEDGSERYTIRIRDLQGGADLPVAIPGTLGSFAWSRDGKHLVYGLVNESWRVDTIKLHTIGSDPAQDRILYREPDQGFQASVGMTQSRAWIVIATGDNETSEVRLLPADNPLAQPMLVRARKKGIEYDVEEHDGTLFIHTNEDSTQFSLKTAPLSDPGNWTTRIAADPDFYMTGVTTFAGFFVVEGRERGLDQIEVHSYSGGPGKRIPFPEASYTASLDENPEYDVSKLRIAYESMVTPDTVSEYDVKTGKAAVLKVQEIPSGYDPSNYVTERVEITARDGTRVPVSVVYRKGFRKDGNGPLYL